VTFCGSIEYEVLQVTVVAVAVDDAVAFGVAAAADVAFGRAVGLAVVLGAVAGAAGRVALAEGCLLALTLPTAFAELSVLGWLTAMLPPLTV
jgi:hypothetical protein